MNKCINSNLISLKCVIFFFLGGIGCIYPFFPVHMRAVEFTVAQCCWISIIVPLITIIGPLVAALLADRLSVGRGCEATNAGGGGDANNAGSKVLRIILAVCLLLAALFYALLISVPNVTILEPRRPSVGFICGANGASVYQEMCTEEKMCNHWDDEKTGQLLLSECKYACEKPPVASPLFMDVSSTTEEPSGGEDYDGNSSDSEVEPEINLNDDADVVDDGRNRRQIAPPATFEMNKMPHICHSDGGADATMMCNVYTEETKQITINARLFSASDEFVASNETTWCRHPLGGRFQCVVPEQELELLNKELEGNDTCTPVIECKIDDPYDSEDSVLAEAQCKEYIGDPTTSFALYLLFRSLGDMFSLAALCLISTACIIATRETSLGRGDVGRQFAFGVIGLALVPPIVGAIHSSLDLTEPAYLLPIIVTVCFYIIAALILIFDNGMPLTPPEWWWHTKSGMLALPMNTIRRYGGEIAGLVVVLVLLGIFWSAMDTYLAWSIVDLKGSDFLLSLTMTVGSLPAIPVLWKAEKLVDYCGHSNIFIAAFTFYILRYTTLALLDDPWWVMFCEVFEVFTLSLMWITAVLYFRHLFPRKYTALGQAFAVVAHFCIGRFLGAIIGVFAMVTPEHPFTMLQVTYKAMAFTACVFGILYLLLYHFVLAPQCRASTTSPPIVMQGLNSNGASNGNYTPLRIYHNERGRKGQFKY